MQSTKNELNAENSQQSLCGKTSPASCRPKITPSARFLDSFPAKSVNWSHQGKNGRTLVMCLDPKEQSRGASLMPNISAWPNDASVCLLSQVLEQTSIPQEFFLSPKACEGILRRAENRGKTLPEALGMALRAVSQQGK